MTCKGGDAVTGCGGILGAVCGICEAATNLHTVQTTNKDKTMRTKEEIQAEIAKLTEMKPRVRQFSNFGDDNHKEIDEQLYVLRTDMDDDDALELEGAAYDAYQWKQGDEDESPSASWEPLLVK